MKRLILTLATLIGVFFLTACNGEPTVGEPTVHRVAQGDFLMDTWAEILIFYESNSPSPTRSLERRYENLAQDALEYARYLEGIFSRFEEGTDVWRVNHAGGEYVEVSPYLVTVLQYSLHLREMTAGRMDVTIGAVRDLWNFEANDYQDVRVPTEEELAQALPSVGTGIIIDGNRVRLEHPQAQLDLGGIAKGFIADRAAAFLRENGVEHAVVNMGGDNVMIGGNPNGTPFRTGIPAPGAIGIVDGWIGVALIEDKTMLGSGIDQRSFWQDGVFYHHILDVDTGMPVDTDMLSVFIISESAILGEGLTTAMYTMGREMGMALVEGIPNAHAVLFIDTGRADGFELQATSGVGYIPPTEEDSRFTLYFE